MTYQHISVEPLTPTIGATVDGVDLTQPLDDAVMNEIHDAWMEHLVLFFRDQPMSHEQHLAFGRRFGDLHIHPAAPFEGGNPELMIIHTDKDSFRTTTASAGTRMSRRTKSRRWRASSTSTMCRRRAAITCWSNMYAAYEALSEPMKELLDPLTAQHASDYTGQYGDHKPQREFPSAVHPVVRTHPVTGKKALFVNEVFTRRIIELPRDESKALDPELPRRPRQERQLPVPLPVGRSLCGAVGQPLHPAHGDLGLLPGVALQASGSRSRAIARFGRLEPVGRSGEERRRWRSIRNPYLRETVDASRTVLYER